MVQRVLFSSRLEKKEKKSNSRPDVYTTHAENKNRTRGDNDARVDIIVALRLRREIPNTT